MTSRPFALTTRPPGEVFYKRGAQDDPRLGEVVGADRAAYEAVQVVLLGCPQDEGVRRNQGRPGAAQAPDAIRRCLYRLPAGKFDLTLCDLGNTRILPTLEETHAAQREIVRHLIRDGKIVISLGGGNDIAYPDCAALADETGDVLAFNIDTHFDARPDAIRNSGTPYRQLLEEGHLRGAKFYEMGSAPFANAAAHEAYLREKGAQIVPLEALRRPDVAPVFGPILKQHSAVSIFWGIDLDVVRAADAPGVSAPNPVGLPGEIICQIAQIAGGDPRTRILEFAEVNPACDIDGRTCRLTAVAIFYFLLARAAQ